MQLNIPVILGSVREGRMSIHPAQLVVEKLEALGHRTQLVDFKELPLPFLDTPKEPSEYKKDYPNENAKKWSSIADAADGFVVVTPEYNHGYPAVLKNAFDWLYPEFYRKAVGFVGVSSGKVGGARAIEQLRPIMENFGMFAVRETVMFGPVKDAFNLEGQLMDETFHKKIDSMLQSLLFSADAMAQARKKV